MIDGLLASAQPIAAPIALLILVLVLVTIARRRLTRDEPLPQGGPEPDLLAIQHVERPRGPAVAAGEENVPRWLRPSLRAERFGVTSGTRREIPAALLVAPPTRTPLAFGSLPGEPERRRLVRLDGVSLLDAPHDVDGRTVAQLNATDEVEILDEAGDWLNVFTPTMQAGWLRISDVQPTGPSPAGWHDGPSTPVTEVDDLAAILASRSRRLPATEPPMSEPEAPAPKDRRRTRKQRPAPDPSV